ncbi:Na+/H+ antiporter [Gryllotalpicola kribbensis]|jgi:CPA1 family monovalent cation:H+ antiporter|uniref:Na+/H+ antiporter n=1 Tax=Gryllotalpicola kribbensis TaxID=993084 RepID=A0ABP8AWB5_9MICO
MGSDAALVLLAVVGAVVLAVVVTVVARSSGWSAPLMLVAIGAIVALIPGIPRLTIAPDVILYGVLPPLLFSAAMRASLIDLRTRRDPILLSSVGLVAFTVLAVGGVSWLIVPGISVAAALAFGAVVAPTDQVAVEAVTRRAGMPRMLSTVLDGENLLNDATALVALNSAIVAITATITPVEIGVSFVLEVVAGLAAGLLVGFVLGYVRGKLAAPVLDTSLSLVTPYLAFLLAQAAHGSGALAVVVAGLFLGYRAPSFQSAQARVAEELNWRTIQFIVENLVFLLIGLTLPRAVEAAAESGIPVGQLIGIAVALLAAVVVTRLIWGAVVTPLFRYGPARMRRVGWPWVTIVPWTLAGVRGVVTLAAVFLLPAETPDRAVLQLLAFVIVIGTLLLAVPIPRVLRRAGLVMSAFDQERVEAELLMAEAKAAGLDLVRERAGDSTDPRVLERLTADAEFVSASVDDGPLPTGESLNAAYAALRIELFQAERKAVLQARAEGRYQEAAVRKVMHVIDAEETAARVLRHGEV